MDRYTVDWVLAPFVFSAYLNSSAFSCDQASRSLFQLLFHFMWCSFTQQHCMILLTSRRCKHENLGRTTWKFLTTSTTCWTCLNFNISCFSFSLTQVFETSFHDILQARWMATCICLCRNRVSASAKIGRHSQNVYQPLHVRLFSSLFEN